MKPVAHAPSRSAFAAFRAGDLRRGRAVGLPASRPVRQVRAPRRGRPGVLAWLAVVVLFGPDVVMDRPVRLEVATADGRIVWSRAVRAGEPFGLAFTHSAERCRWAHHYVVDPERGVWQSGSTAPCIGAGMRVAPAGGRPVRRAGAGFETDAPLAVGVLRMINWRPADITLLHRGREWPIGQWMADWSTFVVRVR